MIWTEFCNCLIPMRQKFGKNCFSDEQVKKGFEQWRNKPQSELLALVNESLSSGVVFILYTHEVKQTRPERTIWKADKYNQTEGFLDRLLALNGCKSVMELVDKEKARKKTGAN